MERFWASVDMQGENGCWVWIGSLNTGGYGQFRRADGTRIVAHRFAYGEVPAGLELDHLCRNRRCVRVSHLEAVTHEENMRRGFYSMKTHCPAGHAYDEANTKRWQTRRYCRACHRALERNRRFKSTAAGTLPSLRKQEDPASRSRLTTVSGT